MIDMVYKFSFIRLSVSLETFIICSVVATKSKNISYFDMVPTHNSGIFLTNLIFTIYYLLIVLEGYFLFKIVDKNISKINVKTS